VVSTIGSMTADILAVYAFKQTKLGNKLAVFSAAFAVLLILSALL